MEVLYKDEATNAIWLGVNPRGCYIDMKRVSDGFIIENVHSVGRHVNGIGYQCMYRNKTSYSKFPFKSVFSQTTIV
jgi:hypothetical protein